MASRRLLPHLLRSTPSRFASAPSRTAFNLHLPQSTPLRIATRFSTTPSHRDTTPPQAPDYLDESERRIFDLLVKDLQPTKLEVQDISGGCGSMYALDIVSAQFAGLPVIKQHRLVNKVLGEEIKKWHGVQLKTKAP